MSNPLITATRLIEGFRATALIALAVRMAIFDELTPAPRRSSDLAKALSLHERSLHRVLRGLTILGIVEEFPDSMFGLTEPGLLLRSDSNSPLPHYARLCETQYLPAFLNMESMLRENVNPFEAAFGKPVWQYRHDTPEAGTLFNQWLHNQSSPVADNLIASVDFSAFKTIADVGGGKGILLARILRACPNCRGILADQSSVVQEAKAFFHSEQLTDRCVFAPTDFFESVPDACDAYVLKSILHDWEDQHCGRILASIHTAMPSPAHLFIVERILPELAKDDPETIWMDLMMMNVTGGRERTLKEYETLLNTAGLRLARTVPLGGSFQALDVVKR